MITLTREEAQQVLDALYRFVEYDYQGSPLDGKDVEGHEAIETLRARLSAPEPSIVEDAIVYGTGITMGGNRIDPASIYKEPEPEPVAWMNEGDIGKTDWKVWAHGKPTATIPLYTALPQREWQGLTDEERYLGDARSEEEIEYARAIEAKLKEKNG